MKIASFFETLGVIAFGLVLGIVLSLFFDVTPTFGQCLGPDCVGENHFDTENQDSQHAAVFDSVLRVRTTEGRWTICYGSGAVVRWGPVRLFLTANHVVQSNPAGVQVNVGERWISLREVYRNGKYDVALYTAPENVPELELAVPSGLQSNTLFYIGGFGGDGKKSATTVYYEKMFQNDVMVCTGSVIQGDSGGPVLTPEGFVVGFVFANDGDRNSRSYCTHSRRVAAAIDQIVAKYQQSRLTRENMYVTEIPGMELCQYVDQSGCFGGRCPTPTPIQRDPLSPGFRQTIPDTIFVKPPQLGPTFPPTPPPSPPVTVNVPQDQTVIAGWIGNLSGKIDTQNQRLDATEQAVGAAIGQAQQIVQTTNGRLTDLETQSALNAREREKLPETMNAVVKANYPFIAAIAAAVVIAALMIRRFLDKRDGQLDGVVDFQGLRQRRRALYDARDGVIDLEPASQIAKQAKLEADIEALKAQLAARSAL